MLRSQNYFSRSSGNDRRMGAFYTDNAHCRSIREMLVFPNDEEVTALDPSIGDGQAVITVTGAETNPQMKIFGVELNGEVAEKTAENPLITEVLKADFLEGTRIRKQSFSFCFANPPYQNDNLSETGSAERTEKQFLERITELLTKDAFLVWVVPYRSFVDAGQFRFMLSRYDVKTVYRFRPEEYAKYHQVVVIAQKKEGRMLLRQEILDAYERYQEKDIPVLPEHPQERFAVPSSSSELLTLFTTKEFDANAAFQRLENMATDPAFDDLNQLISKKLTQKNFEQNKAGRPPIPPKKDTLYLMATSGYGAGITGSEENHDVHLQRGVAEVIEESSFEPDPNDPDKEIERVTSRTQVTMTVVENNGRITVLE